MSFFVELWESVLTPGTTPALIKATHGSFILLILSLLSLIYLSRSIHFINLLVIALLLYGSVVWFINELNQAKMKDNAELSNEQEQVETNETTEADKTKVVEEGELGGVSTDVSTGVSGDASESKSVKKRKV